MSPAGRPGTWMLECGGVQGARSQPHPPCTSPPRGWGGTGTALPPPKTTHSAVPPATRWGRWRNGGSRALPAAGRDGTGGGGGCYTCEQTPGALRCPDRVGPQFRRHFASEPGCGDTRRRPSPPFSVAECRDASPLPAKDLVPLITRKAHF